MSQKKPMLWLRTKLQFLASHQYFNHQVEMHHSYTASITSLVIKHSRLVTTRCDWNKIRAGKSCILLTEVLRNTKRECTYG